MKLITETEAREIVSKLTDGNDKGIDPGIFDAVVNMTRVTKALGFETFNSCEGHIDWGNPYPAITFVIPNHKVRFHSFWKFWKWHHLVGAVRHKKWHNKMREKRTDDLCSLFTRLMVEHDRRTKPDSDSILRVQRRGAFFFCIIPVHSLLSEVAKSSGDHQELDSLLASQRQTFISFSLYCIDHLEHSRNFVGTPEDGCPGCRGRI